MFIEKSTIWLFYYLLDNKNETRLNIIVEKFKITKTITFKSALWRHKNKGLSISFLGIFFSTSPHFYDVTWLIFDTLLIQSPNIHVLTMDKHLNKITSRVALINTQKQTPVHIAYFSYALNQYPNQINPDFMPKKVLKEWKVQTLCFYMKAKITIFFWLFSKYSLKIILYLQKIVQ